MTQSETNERYKKKTIDCAKDRKIESNSNVFFNRDVLTMHLIKKRINISKRLIDVNFEAYLFITYCKNRRFILYIMIIA